MTEPRQRSVLDTALPIHIASVTKTYGKVFALDTVSIGIESGEFLTLLGPSGSGKTTLLMVLAGFVRPDHGSVRFGETEVIRLPPHKRDVGMVFQNYALFPHMNVADNIGFPLKLRKVALDERRERVERALTTVQLAGFGERRIDQLSGGQRQRVALARAIVFEPRILLMDEPLSALDKQLREHMQIELRRLHEQLGMTTVYVTHDQREALTMSDRVAVIDHGRLVQLDRPRTLYERPNSPFVAGFIGESTLLPIDHDGVQPTYAGRALRIAESLPQRGRWLVLRPERLKVLGAEPDSDETYNRLPGRVHDVVFQGESFVVYVVLPDGTEVAVRRASQRETLATIPEPGSEITLGLHPEETLLLDGEQAKSPAGGSA